jgi:hypothetical protein
VRLALAMLTLILGALTVGCEVVDDSDYAIVQKIKGGQYTAIATQELSQLKQQAELGKGVGRYQIHRDGGRTWRLDTSTGAMCIMLASESDWKKPETKAQGCY